MNKRQFHQLVIRELVKLRRDKYAMEAKAVWTARRVRQYLRVGNREQAEAHKAAAKDMAMTVDFIQGEIEQLHSRLNRVLAA